MAHDELWHPVTYRGYAGRVKAVNRQSAIKQFQWAVDNYAHSLHVPGVEDYLEREYGTTIQLVPDRTGD